MAKTDMERVGLFTEQGYTTIGDPYVPPGRKPYIDSASKGKQMMIGGTKSKTASQDGYFEKKFDRIMEAEAYSDPVKKRRKDRLDEAKKNLGKAFVPSNGTKHPSGLGSHYGTLSGTIQSFSAANKPKDKHKSPGKNFLTNPGKNGTGYGYAGVTIGSGYKYQSEPLDRGKEMRKRDRSEASKKVKGGPFKLNSHPKDLFDENPYRTEKPQPQHREMKHTGERPKPFKPSSPAKLAGGCKAGTFDPYPKHSVDLYSTAKIRKETSPSKLKGGMFRPSPGPKSTPTNSVMQQGVIRRMNTTNYLTATPAM